MSGGSQAYYLLAYGNIGTTMKMDDWLHTLITGPPAETWVDQKVEIPTARRLPGPCKLVKLAAMPIGESLSKGLAF